MDSSDFSNIILFLLYKALKSSIDEILAIPTQVPWCNGSSTAWGHININKFKIDRSQDRTNVLMLKPDNDRVTLNSNNLLPLV